MQEHKANLNLGHEYPQTRIYYFLDGTRCRFCNVIFASLSTWEHVYQIKDGRQMVNIVNPNNVKFTEVIKEKV